MILLETCFWLLLACVVYTYVLYPLFLVLARPRGSSGRSTAPLPGAVSIVVAARNEEGRIGRRVRELLDLIGASGLEGEVIVVSDGSTDGTACVARSFTKEAVRVVELPEREGKASALTKGCALARHDVLVFADARQSWAPDALRLLLENFTDPSVGAASGDLVVESGPGALAGVGAYWRYEKCLRRLESRLYSTVGVTGAICAVRRELFRPIPPGTLLDDVYWPLRVAMQGYRVVHDSRARAYDRLPEKVRDEFRRKVRTLTGNFQLLTLLPEALLPWRNPVWFQFLSHKVLRLVVPWALLGTLALSAALGSAWVYAAAFWAQAAFYLLGLAGISPGIGKRLRPASAAASFVVLNAAAWLAFWNWALGRSGRSWGKVVYAAAPADAGKPPYLFPAVARQES